MATEIRVWQVENDVLTPIDTTLTEAGRTERHDLERWVRSDPGILGQGILVIGEQVETRSGPLDFLAVDRDGNTVIIELKRDRIPRLALAQAIDYASDIASWGYERLNEECEKYRNQRLDEYVGEQFDDIDLGSISFNVAQRIVVVGSDVEESLQRMIEWLSEKFEVNINAIVLKYIQTRSGDELLARTMIIPEEVEKQRTQRQQRKIPMSDEPGDYDEQDLVAHLSRYLADGRATPRRIKNILLPLCLDHEPVKRQEIKDTLIGSGEAKDEGHAGILVTSISRELGIQSRDYLRQVIRYEKPNPWEKEDYRIDEKHKAVVGKVLDSIAQAETGGVAQDVSV